MTTTKRMKSCYAVVEMTKINKRKSSTIRKDSKEPLDIAVSAGMWRKITGPMREMKTKGCTGIKSSSEC